jgi:acetolactate synthase-1/2/3 large subunit
MNGSELIAEILKKENVKFLSCFPSQPLIEACAKLNIKPIMCRQERIGAAIADGISRSTGGKHVGVFAMQQGPGAENSFPGAAQSFADNVPVLIIPGGESLNKSFISPNFISTNNYANVTKWMAQVNDINRLPQILKRAFYALKTGKPGPVLIEIPAEIWDQNLNELNYTPVKKNLIRPDYSEINNITDVILNAKNPVLYAGQGIMYSDAEKELLNFAETLNIPVMTTMPGKSSFPENHELSLGSSAVSTTKMIYHFLSKSDVVFAIGTSLTRTPYGRDIPEGKTIIHSTNDPFDINKDYNVDYGLIGDSKLVLQDLISCINNKVTNFDKYNNLNIRQEIKKIKKEWLSEWENKLHSDETPLNPYRVVNDLMQTVDLDNTIITHDAGSPRDQIVPFWESTVPKSYIGWGKTTQLGYGLGVIMGAKLANPEKLCINIMGDAAIGMVGMDIETAVRNNIGILTIVLNNGAMAIERPTMPTAIEKYKSHSQGGNYKEVAEALGGWGIRVEKPEKIISALSEAINITRSGKPALVEFITKENFDFSKYE